MPDVCPVSSGAPARLHDPRVDPPTRADRRRLRGWIALLSFTPVCLGVVVWATLDLNGGYPTVKPPVPKDWQAVRGIYASISVPKSWQLQQQLSDDNGDIYYSGPGGGVGLSTVEADHLPSHTAGFPTVIKDFLGGDYSVVSISRLSVHSATDAWAYRFEVDGKRAAAILAWVKPTLTRVWLVATVQTKTTDRVFSTLSLAR